MCLAIPGRVLEITDPAERLARVEVAGVRRIVNLGLPSRIVYSPLDALRVARENPQREMVFFAIGFETTAPSTALTLRQAKAAGVGNFSCLSNHITIVPPLKALLEAPDLRLDGSSAPATCAPWSAPARSSSSRASTASRW